jgi:hypothetical protein
MEVTTYAPADWRISGHKGGDFETPPQLKPLTLPREIVFPMGPELKEYYEWYKFDHHISSIINLARGLADDVWRLKDQKPGGNYKRSCPEIVVDGSTPTVIKESEDLKPVDWSSFSCLVDGTEVIFDTSDWHVVNGDSVNHKHWLRMRYISSHRVTPSLGPFVIETFQDWAHYEVAQREIREKRDPMTVTKILNNQPLGCDFDSRYRRRLMVRGMLHSSFGDRADFDWTPPDQFYAKAEKALCYVSVPGSYQNSLDRGQLQMMGLGIPTISPIVYEQCCYGMLQPGIHYLACRHDYKDIPDLVAWCEKNRAEAAAMGHNAWLFFQEFCTPLACWSYVKDRIDNGSWYTRDTLDNDLSPPGLYKP